jgi:hypothetical protein
LSGIRVFLSAAITAPGCVGQSLRAAPLPQGPGNKKAGDRSPAFLLMVERRQW